MTTSARPPQRRTANAETAVSSAEYPELSNVFSFKPGVGEKTLRASPTAEILSHFSLPGSFDGFLLGFVVVVVVVGFFYRSSSNTKCSNTRRESDMNSSFEDLSLSLI